MTPAFPHDPRERDLMDRLNRAIPPHQNTVGTDADPLVNAAQRLASGPRPRLSNAAERRIEARLRAHAAASRAVDSQRRAPRFRIAPVLHLGLAASLILLLVVTGAARASADSLPGDLLYPVKRAVENGRLALVSDEGEPALRVELAERRLDEFGALLTRQTIKPDVLAEASAQLTRALDLLWRGQGDRQVLDPQIADLAYRQAGLSEQALPLAGAIQGERLQVVVQQSVVIQERVALEGSGPEVIQEVVATPTVTATATVSATPTVTFTATMTLTPTSTPTATATPSPTPTPTATATTVPSATPEATTTRKPTIESALDADEPTPARPVTSVKPTRTPPGHGATPGLGSNPPGQGGDHPGIGNDGQPPGQDKIKKDK